MDPAKYSSFEKLRNGRNIEIRAMKPDDRDQMLGILDRASNESLYRRFFSPRRTFNEKAIDYLVNVDFVKHVALVAVLEEDGRYFIAGGGRYIVFQPGCAELAFGVDEACRGQGIASVLLHHLVSIARGAGLGELHAEVLVDNKPMIKVFEKSGLAVMAKSDGNIKHMTLSLH